MRKPATTEGLHEIYRTSDRIDHSRIALLTLSSILLADLVRATARKKRSGRACLLTSWAKACDLGNIRIGKCAGSNRCWAHCFCRRLGFCRRLAGEDAHSAFAKGTIT